jgi:hypothetical protein
VKPYYKPKANRYSCKLEIPKPTTRHLVIDEIALGTGRKKIFPFKLTRFPVVRGGVKIFAGGLTPVATLVDKGLGVGCVWFGTAPKTGCSIQVEYHYRHEIPAGCTFTKYLRSSHFKGKMDVLERKVFVEIGKSLAKQIDKDIIDELMHDPKWRKAIKARRKK